jgi:4-amino-4-deoxy-L-arabinose transferase-like glycosyltransferase
MSRINSVTAKYAILFFGCVTFHIIGTWSLPLVDRDEPRFAEASREMIERGDCVVPYFNNQLRLDKPPLTYWMQMASYRIFGQNDFGARFPSTVAAALVALLILAWGTRIANESMGLRAAIIFTLCLQTFIHAKAAVADLWLVLFVTTAHWAGYQLLQRRTPNPPPPWRGSAVASAERPTSNWLWWLIFYASLALGFLAKGPIAWTPLLTLAAMKFFARDLKPAGRFKFVRGILLMFAIVALWAVPALVRTEGAFFAIGIGRHVVARSFGVMEGHGWNSLGGYMLFLPFYFVTIFVSFFPWSISLPALVRKLWPDKSRLRESYGDQVDNYLIAGIAIVFIIFTLVKTKLPHYTLPAFPLLAILLARHWTENAASGPGDKLDRLNRSGLTIPKNQSVTGRGRSWFRTIGIVTAFFWIAVALIIPPLIAGSFPAYSLFRQSRDYLRPEMEFGAVDYQEPSLVWYFRSRIKGWMTPLRPAKVSGFMEKPGPRFVILPAELASTMFTNLPPGWRAFSDRGFNLAKGKRVDLTLILKPD